MAKVCLVSCVSLKDNNKAKARDLYLSPLFIKAKEYTDNNFDQWYILSAKYGLVHPETIIEPYEKTLNKMSKKERREWSKNVFKELVKCTDPEDEITFIAGERYREDLTPLLLKRGNKIYVPMEGLGIGKQLQWLSHNSAINKNKKHLIRFYTLLNDLEIVLGGKRLFKDCHGRLDWPERGVYFFFEPNEYRTTEPSKLRIVRVGTHMVSKGSKATFWNRLHTHKGTGDGGGNHRASIFRLHVGNAIISKSKGDISVPSWGISQITSPENALAELHLEQKVSEYISKMSLLWINVPDIADSSSDRAFIEKNSIGLLSCTQSPIDVPSNNWLGNYSPNDAVRKSGLWNVNYTDYQYDERFLEVLENYVDAMAGNCKMPNISIAPKDWHSADRGKDIRGQLFLFEEE